MTEKLEAFLNACQKVRSELQILSGLEQEKRQSLLKYEIKEVESITNKQQAIVMKLEGLERRRMLAQAEAGFGDSTATEIILLLDRQDKSVFSDVFNELAILADSLKISNKACLDIVSTELNILKTRLPDNTPTFSQPGKRGYNNYTKSTFNGTV